MSFWGQRNSCCRGTRPADMALSYANMKYTPTWSQTSVILYSVLWLYSVIRHGLSHLSGGSHWYPSEPSTRSHLRPLQFNFQPQRKLISIFYLYAWCTVFNSWSIFLTVMTRYYKSSPGGCYSLRYFIDHPDTRGNEWSLRSSEAHGCSMFRYVDQFNAFGGGTSLYIYILLYSIFIY